MKPARGFTLIEIMVVMVIIGIMALMIGLSVGNRSSEDRMEAEARRIQQLLQFASDEAQAKGLEPPAYVETARSGPDHAPVFTISVSVRGFEAITATGTSKKLAEHQAAEKFLLREGVWKADQ